MLPTEANIVSVVKTSDNTGVVVTYTTQEVIGTDDNGNPINAVYSTTFPSANAPDQTDITAQDNYDYYTSLILGT